VVGIEGHEISCSGMEVMRSRVQEWMSGDLVFRNGGHEISWSGMEVMSDIATRCIDHNDDFETSGIFWTFTRVIAEKNCLQASKSKNIVQHA